MSFAAVSVGGTATLILASNVKRKSYIITNTSTADKLYIGENATITTSTGIEIPTGGSISEDSGGEKCYTGDIYGIAGNTVSVRYWERV